MLEPTNVFNDITDVESFNYDSMSISDRGIYNYCKQLFIEEIRRSLLAEKQYWLGDLGYLEARIGDQGGKNPDARLKNIKFKFIPNESFKKKVKSELFTKHGIDIIQRIR